VGPAFANEALYAYADDTLTERVRLSVEKFAAAAINISELRLTDPEVDGWVKYASRLDDGEAQALALAAGRGLAILTDDTAGIRLGNEIGVEVVTSLDLAHSWSATATADGIRAACRRLRHRARFAVPRQSPHADWYRSMLDG